MIMQIVNASLQSGTVPADMKHALVTPLHKRNGLDSNNFANYRPVSNIGFVSKVLERYVANACANMLTTMATMTPFKVPIDRGIALRLR